VIEYRDRVHLTPDYLMYPPCRAIEAGETVGSLAEGYIHNTFCIKSYEALLDSQKEYKREVQSIYNK